MEDDLESVSQHDDEATSPPTANDETRAWEDQGINKSHAKLTHVKSIIRRPGDDDLPEGSARSIVQRCKSKSRVSSSGQVQEQGE